MTNKFYTESAVISIYVVNIGKHEDNNLIGAWVSLPIKKRDFRDFLFTIGNPEKVKIHDYKDNLGLDGLEIGKYKSLTKVNQLAKRMESIDTSEVATFNTLYEALGNFEEALDCFESDNREVLNASKMPTV